MKNLTATFKDSDLDCQARIEKLISEERMDYDKAFEIVYEMGGRTIDDDFDEIECHTLDDGFSFDAGAFDGGEW